MDPTARRISSARRDLHLGERPALIDHGTSPLAGAEAHLPSGGEGERIAQDGHALRVRPAPDCHAAAEVAEDDRVAAGGDAGTFSSWITS